MIKAVLVKRAAWFGRVRLKSSLFLLFFLVIHCAFPAHADVSAGTGKEDRMLIKMTIGQRHYDIELEDNPTAKAFIQQLPLTLTMQELNGNEKFADLSHSLITHPIGPEIVHKGDLMLYGRQTLVLFYETFRTSYRYTPIGRVVAPDTLEDAIGHSSIEVNFLMIQPVNHL